MNTLYEHGEITNLGVTSITCVSFEITDSKTHTMTKKYIREFDDVSILVRRYDNEHMANYTIYRGHVIRIDTNVPSNCSQYSYPKYIRISLDCSSESISDKQIIKLSEIVDVNGLDHEYVEKEIIEYTPDIPDNDWTVQTENEVLVDFESGITG